MAFPSIIAKASKPIKSAKATRELSGKVLGTVLFIANITSNDEAPYSKAILASMGLIVN